VPCVILHRLQKSSPFQGGRIEPDFRLDVYMIRKKKFVFLILLFIGALYFFIFWFPNATGARDQNMLSVFKRGWNRPISLYGENAWGAFHSFSNSFPVLRLSTILLWFPILFLFRAAALLPLKLLGAAGSVSTKHAVLKAIGQRAADGDRAHPSGLLQTVSSHISNLYRCF